MRPLPPGQDGVDYCKIRRDRTHHHHHHQQQQQQNQQHHHHHGSGGGGGGGTLRRSSAASSSSSSSSSAAAAAAAAAAALLEPPSSIAGRYHGTIEGHYRVHDLALDRYVPPPSPERYSSSGGGGGGGGSSIGRSSYHHQHHQQQHHHQQNSGHHHQHPDDRYASSSSSSSASCHGTTTGGGRNGHYLPVSQSASESFMSPPSPVAERFDYAARHHDSYASVTKRNDSVYSRSVREWFFFSLTLVGAIRWEIYGHRFSKSKAMYIYIACIYTWICLMDTEFIQHRNVNVGPFSDRVTGTREQELRCGRFFCQV